MTSGLSPFSALVGSTLDTCLRQSMRFLEVFHTFWTFVFQRSAWFDSGFLLIRQTTQALTVQTADICGTSAVAVLLRRRHFFHDAQADFHGLAQQTIRVSW